jgi:hypothetical protein
MPEMLGLSHLSAAAFANMHKQQRDITQQPIEIKFFII